MVRLLTDLEQGRRGFFVIVQLAEDLSKDKAVRRRLTLLDRTEPNDSPLWDVSALCVMIDAKNSP